MSEAALDSLDAAAKALRAAMEAGDTDAIEKLIPRLSTAAGALADRGAVRSDADTRARVRALMKRLDSDRTLARLLDDHISQNMASAAIQGTVAGAGALTYGRSR